MRRAILVGGGASVKEGIELGLWDKIRGEDIWSINYAFMAMPYVPLKEVWVDVAFYRNNTEELQKLYEKGCSLITRIHPAHAGILEFTSQYNSTTEASKFFGKEAIQKNCVFRGRMGLSGVYALSLAVASGYKEIYLLGYDFGTPDIKENNTHFYQKTLNVWSTGVNHPEVYRLPGNKVKREVTDFKLFNNLGIEIFNVSVKSNIDCFTKLTYTEFFERLTNVHL